MCSRTAGSGSCALYEKHKGSTGENYSKDGCHRHLAPNHAHFKLFKMEPRRSVRRRPQRPQAAAIMATAAAARNKKLVAPPPPAPVRDPSPAVRTSFTATTRSSHGALTELAPQDPPQGLPRKHVSFPRISAANGLSPGGTTTFRQALGMRFNRMSLFDREQYTRYIGEEDGQRGTVDEHYCVVPYGTVAATRPAFAPSRLYSPPYSITPLKFPPGFKAGPRSRHRRAPLELVTPWKRAKRTLKRHSMLMVVVVCMWVALLLKNDSNQLADRLKAVLWPLRDSDSDGNATRILIDPFGYGHMTHITALTLATDNFCNRMDGTGLLLSAKEQISRNIQYVTSWHEQLWTSEEPELRDVAQMYNDRLTRAHILKADATDLEFRMCLLADTLIGKGLAFNDTVRFAHKLKTYNAEADKLRRSQKDSKQSITRSAAKIGDWDQDLVNDVFGSLQAYLLDRKELAKNMSAEVNGTIAPWLAFQERYTAFGWLPYLAKNDTQTACVALEARKLGTGESLPSQHCTAESPLDTALMYRDMSLNAAWAGHRYLQDTRDVWMDYATHMQDGVSLLDNLPQFKSDLAAEGTPPRMDALAPLLSGLANQANLTAMILQDAYERKYEVPLDLDAIPRSEEPLDLSPPKLGYCGGCDERAASSWSSSSSSTESQRSSSARRAASLALSLSGDPMTVTWPGSERVVDASPTGFTVTTVTDFIKVVNVLG